MRTSRRHRSVAVLALLAVWGAGGCGGTRSEARGAPVSTPTPGVFPLTLRNCGTEYTYAAPPRRIVSTGTTTTELVLALGGRDALVGAVAPGALRETYAAEFAGVPIIARSAFPPPSKEVVFAADPHLIVSTYPDDYGPKAIGDRARLAEDGVDSFLMSGNCPGHKARLDDVYADIRDLGALLDRPARAAEVSAALRARLDQVPTPLHPTSVFVYSGGEAKPTTSGSHQLVDDLVARLGGRTIFPEVTDFSQVSWEEVVARDPDTIVIEGLQSTSAEQAVAFLTSYGPIADLRAVRERRFVVIPLNDLQPGLRVADGYAALATGLAR